MINEQTLKGNWNEMRGKIREKWSQLTDNDLGEFNGNVDQLVGRIQQRTGAARATVEEYLGQISAAASTMMGRMGEAVQSSAENVSHMAQDTVANAEDFVKNRPGQAVALAFGVGLVAGLGIAICMQRPRRQTTWERAASNAETYGRQALNNAESYGRQALSTSEQFGRQMLNALASCLPESMASHLRS